MGSSFTNGGGLASRQIADVDANAPSHSLEAATLVLAAFYWGNRAMVKIRSKEKGPWWKLWSPKVLITVGSKTLEKASLRSAKLTGADLAGMKLCGANLRHAILKGADLKGADLKGADLEEAKLVRADLSEAILVDANLKGADLHDADVRGADLSTANLEETYLKQALYDTQTKWPPGFDPGGKGASVR